MVSGVCKNCTKFSEQDPLQLGIHGVGMRQWNKTLHVVIRTLFILQNDCNLNWVAQEEEDFNPFLSNVFHLKKLALVGRAGVYPHILHSRTKVVEKGAISSGRLVCPPLLVFSS